MSEFFVIKQEPYAANVQNIPPAYVHRATKSPNFGVRLFEEKAKFATKQEAQAWIDNNAGIV